MRGLVPRLAILVCVGACSGMSCVPASVLAQSPPHAAPTVPAAPAAPPAPAAAATKPDAPGPANAERASTEQAGHASAPDKARTVVSVVVGLLGLLALAYVLSHERVRALEQRIGIRSAITAGFPFVGLGLLARHPSVGVLSDDVLVALKPLLQFGLGWLGFLVGFRLDPRGVDALPKRAVRIAAADTLCAFLVIGAAGGALLLALGQEWRDASFLRDGLVLATAGAMTSATARRRQLGARSEARWQQLDDAAGSLGLLILCAYFRPQVVDSAWAALPGTAWLFMAAGMGVTLGMLACLMLQTIRGEAEFMVIVLGTIALGAGMAAYLGLSPLSVCLFTGLVVTSFGGVHRPALSDLLARLERPIHLVFLAIAGALWNPADYRGWLLMLVFVAARLSGLRLSRSLVPLSRPVTRRFDGAPLGVLSIAVVVNAQTLYQGTAVPWLVTAVIGGAIVTEVLAQIDRIGADGGDDEPTIGESIRPPADLQPPPEPSVPPTPPSQEPSS